MRKLKCGVLALLWPVMSCFAQSVPGIRPLSIGDTIPADLELTNVYNYPDSIIRFSDLKGKLVILDFWSTWCGACIEALPKMEELQKAFGEKLQIIMVNSDTSENASKVSGFLERRKMRTGQALSLPYALQNQSTSAQFPHNEIPHYAWLNKDGKVVGITTADDVTKENITEFLHDGSKILYTKKDYLRFNPDKPLLIDENGGDNPEGFIYRSIITNYKANLGSFINATVDSPMKRSQFDVINYSLLSLFQIAYPKLFIYDLKRVIIELSDKSEFINSGSNNNKYCYELITSLKSRDDMLLDMQQSLINFFNIIPVSEKRNRMCYLLEANQNVVKIISKGGIKESDLNTETLRKFIHNKPITELTNFLNSILDKPVIDSSKLLRNIDINFPIGFTSFTHKQIKGFLRENGLEVRDRMIPIQVTVLKDLR